MLLQQPGGQKRALMLGQDQVCRRAIHWTLPPSYCPRPTLILPCLPGHASQTGVGGLLLGVWGSGGVADTRGLSPCHSALFTKKTAPLLFGLKGRQMVAIRRAGATLPHPASRPPTASLLQQGHPAPAEGTFWGLQMWGEKPLFD